MLVGWLSWQWLHGPIIKAAGFIFLLENGGNRGWSLFGPAHDEFILILLLKPLRVNCYFL